ncbi:MAG TPA: carbohydrate ABC transporter permease [Candidatus Sumerlaeota bacterium]|nr:carbohydrate ABC transporter permease [Candidatus Sumerlaeota bacterium]HON49256.1 carbohydrate ABC transporter permease [Candidatus Sumerlaeota bacterium]HOR64137.1 carbohydrate ABC transporter permease [Candidatus Sumerlaeota bacterium]HPL73150.1 carbohydrate ABC transporter permease [Candidatus Sumerlaeota bacterium]HRU53501.1 carbohydrate ABC transporter permease [Candidatus Sumerlaeia bacterium]
MKKIRLRLIQFFLLAAAVVFLTPIALIFLTSLKPDSEIIHFSGIFPRQWTLDNFREIFDTPEEIPIFRWLLNSVFISSAVTFLILLVNSMAAYALARLELPGRRGLFVVIIATLMIPGQILMIPVYLIINKLGLLNTPWALIIPAGAGAFGVFLLHQFFLGIPRNLEDAAIVDGCSIFGVYRHIVLPLSKPALSTLGIFTFLGSWNDFLSPLIFLDSVDKFTLPVGVALFQTSYAAEYGLTLAACVVCTAPALLAFVFFQRHIIKGIALTGLKE